MTHLRYAAATADAQVGRIMDALEASGELDSTLVVLTADHGSVAAAPGHWHGDFEPVNDYGYFNWYYGDPENDVFYDQPQKALQPLIDTGNVGLSYSDSSLNVWLKDQSPAAVGAGRRHHGGPPGRHRRVATSRRPLRPGHAGPVGPDDVRR